MCSASLPSCPKYLVCSQNTLHDHPPAGLVSRARILVSQVGVYEFQILLRTKDKGMITSEEELLHLCGMISKSSGYKFCPGINKDVYNDHYASIIRFDSKSVRLTSEPFCRVDSPRCELWHKLAKNSSIFERDMEEVLCQPCKKMRSHLDQRVHAATNVTPAVKAARLEPSSRCPLAVLSPSSKKKRKDNLVKERAQYKKKYEHIELMLDDEQSDEMAHVVDIINRDASDTLNKVIEEAETQGHTVRDIWKNDVRASQEEFAKDQAVNGTLCTCCVVYCILITTIICCYIVTGKKSNKWSAVTIRLGKSVCL